MMKKILLSGNFADMALIVGQNKTRIPENCIYATVVQPRGTV